MESGAHLSKLPHSLQSDSLKAKSLAGPVSHNRPSPDLNPIENVLRIMKQRLKTYPAFPDTVEKPKIAVQGEWDRLRPQDWNKYIDSIPDRFAEVKQRNGLATRD